MTPLGPLALVVACLANGGASPLLLLDFARLVEVRAQVHPVGRVFRPGALSPDLKVRPTSEDLRVAAGMAALDADARRALAFGPVSVMDKRVAPPSGDKHDYMSLAPYWWPDPTKPDGRPYIRRDGERNPDVHAISDSDNFDRLADAVPTLALAFYLTGREEYAEHAARLVRAWFLDPATRMNPHLRFGQGIPGITEGRGIGIIETHALPRVIDATLLLDGSRSWSAADADGLRRWMRAYLSWLIESPEGRAEGRNGNNHETWYDVQVAALAMYTGDAALARRTVARGRDLVGRQIEPDGRQPGELARTRAWDYSLFNLDALFALATLGERVDIDLWNYRTSDGRSLRQALDFLVPFATRARLWPYAAITGFRPAGLHRLLRRAALAWHEPRYRSLAATIGDDDPRLTLVMP